MKPVDYAAEVTISDSDAHQQVLAGLAEDGLRDVHTLRNPTSGRDDGMTPTTRTCVVMCMDEMGTQMCIKFYEDSATGKSSLRRHAQLLEGLHGVIPVPKILGLEEEAYRFGLPALVTTFIGASLERSIGAIAGNLRVKLTEDIATSVATLTKLSAKDAGLSNVGLKQLNRSVAKMFTDDAHWYTA